MKALAYICSYKEDEHEFFDDIKLQKEKIEKFAKLENFEVLDFYYEKQFARDDYKPILLELISNFYGKTDKLLVVNNDVISKNENFRDWVQDELSRIGVELKCVCGKQSAAFIKALNIKNKVKSIPSLPEIVVKIIQLVQSGNVSTDELVEVIEKDAGFTVKILKHANSSIYGFSKKISSVQEAVELLGFTTIKGLVLSSEIFKVFAVQNNDEKSFNYKTFWKHNLLTASGVNFLQKILYDESDKALYTSAILHDLGKIILAKYDSINYQKVYSITSKSYNDEENLEIEKKYCGVSHSEIAHMIAEEWNFPDLIQEVLLYHHAPSLSEKFRKECIMVNIADVASSLVLKSIPLSVEFFNLQECKDYNIDEETLCLLYNDLVSQLKSMKNDTY